MIFFSGKLNVIKINLLLQKSNDINTLTQENNLQD